MLQFAAKHSLTRGTGLRIRELIHEGHAIPVVSLTVKITAVRDDLLTARSVPQKPTASAVGYEVCGLPRRARNVSEGISHC